MLENQKIKNEKLDTIVKMKKRFLPGTGTPAFRSNFFLKFSLLFLREVIQLLDTSAAPLYAVN